MQPRSLIIGGTKGLGLCLAQESLKRGITPVILGRTASALRDSLVEDDPLRQAEFMDYDVSDPTQAQKLITAFYPARRQENLLRPVDYVFWNAGKGLREDGEAQEPIPISKVYETYAEMIGLHIGGPFVALHGFLGSACAWKRRRPDLPPIHLITISSTSSWKARPAEAIYCALKAAKSHYTRCVAKRLATEYPGAKTMLVQPGGMATENFWGPMNQDMAGYMSPAAVATIIWDRAQGQEGSFDEYSILRTDDGTPVIKDGPQLPE
jgi:NAD(P)-dependent dehydrogenase (short-subunit alcohol dehydrogenase family)